MKAKDIILTLFATISVLAMVLYLIWTWIDYAMQEFVKGGVC